MYTIDHLNEDFHSILNEQEKMINLLKNKTSNRDDDLLQSIDNILNTSKKNYAFKNEMIEYTEYDEDFERYIENNRKFAQEHNIDISNPFKNMYSEVEYTRKTREIIEKFDVSIDLDREKGEVKVAGSQKGKVEAAKEYIIQITQKDPKARGGKKEVKNIDNFKVDEEFDGEVKKIATFGAFVSLRDGVDGLLHISKIKSPIKEGDRIRVKVSEIKAGKISLDLI
jgi:hypothetical protein